LSASTVKKILLLIDELKRARPMDAAFAAHSPNS
jgi:hypothetical protein